LFDLTTTHSTITQGLGSFAPRSGTRLERSETILTNQKAIRKTIIKQSGKIRKNQKKIRNLEAIRNQKKSDEIRKSDAIRNQKRSYKLDNQMQSEIRCNQKSDAIRNQMQSETSKDQMQSEIRKIKNQMQSDAIRSLQSEIRKDQVQSEKIRCNQKRSGAIRKSDAIRKSEIRLTDSPEQTRMFQIVQK
jgi:hypothetical protein